MEDVKTVTAFEKEKIHKELLVEGLTKTEGNIRDTARYLGVSREWVRRWCLRLRIEPATYRPVPSEWLVFLRGRQAGEVVATTEKNAMKNAIKFTTSFQDISFLRVVKK